MINHADMSLVRVSDDGAPMRIRVLVGDAILGMLCWSHLPGANGGTDGFHWMPFNQGRPSRVLRPLLREALMKSVRLPAKVADRLISELKAAS